MLLPELVLELAHPLDLLFHLSLCLELGHFALELGALLQSKLLAIRVGEFFSSCCSHQRLVIFHPVRHPVWHIVHHIMLFLLPFFDCLSFELLSVSRQQVELVLNVVVDMLELLQVLPLGQEQIGS